MSTVMDNPGSLENLACGDISWTFCDTFDVECPVSVAKSEFNFIRNRWTWICQGFITQVVSQQIENKMPVSGAKMLMLYCVWK